MLEIAHRTLPLPDAFATIVGASCKFCIMTFLRDNKFWYLKKKSALASILQPVAARTQFLTDLHSNAMQS